jgi:hypothetical protein
VDERASLEAGSADTTKKTVHDDTKNNMIVTRTVFFIFALLFTSLQIKKKTKT